MSSHLPPIICYINVRFQIYHHEYLIKMTSAEDVLEGKHSIYPICSGSDGHENSFVRKERVEHTKKKLGGWWFSFVGRQVLP